MQYDYTAEENMATRYDNISGFTCAPQSSSNPLNLPDMKSWSTRTFSRSTTYKNACEMIFLDNVMSIVISLPDIVQLLIAWLRFVDMQVRTRFLLIIYLRHLMAWFQLLVLNPY